MTRNLRPQKERYFHPETLAGDAEALLDGAGPGMSSDALRPVPSACALIILDMQQYFLEQNSHAFVPSAPAIIEPVNRLRSLFISRGRPVIMTRHTNRETDSTMMKRWWRDLIDPDQDTAAITPLIDTQGCTVIEKGEYDAFYRTPLASLLHDSGTSQLIVTGVMTHLCCESTARSGFGHGFEIFFPADATATYTRAFHRASLLNLAHGFAHICLTPDLVRALT